MSGRRGINQSVKDQVSRSFLDYIYPVPVEGPADERYFHADIMAMTELELRREYDQAHHRLVMEQRPHHWLLERMVRLREVIDHADD